MQGFQYFCLEFHLAHLILREDQELSSTIRQITNETYPTPPLARISFTSGMSSHGSAGHYSVHQAHISVVVCGWSNTQWTGYAFAKTGLACQPYDEAADGEDDDPDGLEHDYFAADRETDYRRAIPACSDAREYWLRVVEARCQLVSQEWLYMVNILERGVEGHVSHSVF
jgi:hypothetical protein